MGTDEWLDDAACNGVDVGVFFDEIGSVHGLVGAPARHARWKAKRICATCPVIEQCLNRAVRIGIPFGVYGGLDQKERAGMFGAPGEGKGANFSDAQRRALIERFKYEGFSDARIGRLLGLADDDLARLAVRRRNASGPATVALREYKAWPAVYHGIPPLAIARDFSIPYERVLEMCRVVDKDPEYHGPKGHQRSAYWSQTVRIARLDNA